MNTSISRTLFLLGLSAAIWFANLANADPPGRNASGDDKTQGQFEHAVAGQHPAGGACTPLPNQCPHGDALVWDSNFEGWVCASDLSPLQPYNIGDTGPAGGIVFYVTDGGTHGLEMSPDELGPFQVGVGWGCEGTFIEGANNEQIGTGQQNTNAILAGCAFSTIPARRADEYSLNGYDDWYLPSNLELYEYYRHRALLPPLPHNLYWASTQINAPSARTLDWLNGTAFGHIAKGTVSIAPFGTIGARAVRTF